jgi:predicted S18 family serine protease
VVFELPEGSKDRYRLEVAPPFGGEEVIVHASTAPLGVLDIEATGAVYGVKTQSRDMGIKSRGVQIVVGGPSAPGVKPQGAEFVESRAALQTGK